jgi:hypothetical protein
MRVWRWVGVRVRDIQLAAGMRTSCPHAGKTEESVRQWRRSSINMYELSELSSRWKEDKQKMFRPAKCDGRSSRAGTRGRRPGQQIIGRKEPWKVDAGFVRLPRDEAREGTDSSTVQHHRRCAIPPGKNGRPATAWRSYTPACRHPVPQLSHHRPVAQASWPFPTMPLIAYQS